MAEQVLSLSGVTATMGGTAIEFTMTTAGGDQQLMIPAKDLPLFVQFFAAIAQITDNDGSLPEHLDPIQVDGVGIQDAELPDKTLLIVKIGAAALALEMPRTELADMAKTLLLGASTPAAGAKAN